MNFDPQKFFIGLMDFFTILLPGALLTWLAMGGVAQAVLGATRYAALSGVPGWAAFLFASYLLGHLIFLLSSWLDEFYDWARGFTLDAQIARLARHGRLTPAIGRALVWLVFKCERNLAVGRAGTIKVALLGPLQAKDAINTFQWSKVWLGINSPQSLASVQRLEADSKFFRSFSVLLLILLAAWLWQDPTPLPGALLLVTLLLALWRYMEQRYKSTNQAYWSIIAHAAAEGKVTLEAFKPMPETPPRAGGVVCRLNKGRTQYLLVETSEDPKQWVLPKGHVEERETPRETAIREVLEETGVWARIVGVLGDVSWSADGETATTRFFRMQACGRGLRQDKQRQHEWLALPQAIARASHLETRELLQAAELQRAIAAPASTASDVSTTSN